METLAVTKISHHPVSVLEDPALASSRVLTVPEARALLKCGHTKLYDLMTEGSIRSYRDGGSRRIYLLSVLEYIEACGARGPQLMEKV
jgi:excisionase family DNA binding protein